MFRLLRIFSGAKQSSAVAGVPTQAAEAPIRISAPLSSDFNVEEHLLDASGFPVIDWTAAERWVRGITDEVARAEAWCECERAWLQHLRVALGTKYEVREQGTAMLLSTLQSNVAEATLSFMNKTLKRVMSSLEGLALAPSWGHDILVVFDDEDAYYRYVSHYYPDTGEFARSGGMYINAGCGHFVTVKADLHSIEPTITHELTHACLSHLPIPAWLNEGIAVNTEYRFSPPLSPLPPPQQMHSRHRDFWDASAIQQFWSGESFLRADEGCELSYDLARILVAQFATAWDRFKPFVLAASVNDSGESAAKLHLRVQLGEVVASLLEKPASPDWSPDSSRWTKPERGAFHG